MYPQVNPLNNQPVDSMSSLMLPSLHQPIHQHVHHHMYHYDPHQRPSQRMHHVHISFHPHMVCFLFILLSMLH